MLPKPLKKETKSNLKQGLFPGSAKVLIDEKRKLPGLAENIIQDNGPGIPSHIRERLFEPYNSSKVGAPNSGLGLSIVHAVIKKMQGRITCDSSRGKGTCFTILIPLAPDTRPQGAQGWGACHDKNRADYDTGRPGLPPGTCHRPWISRKETKTVDLRAVPTFGHDLVRTESDHTPE